MENLTIPDITQIDSKITITNPTLAQLNQEADEIQRFMRTTTGITDGNILAYRLNQMDMYLARLSEMSITAKAMKKHAEKIFKDANSQQLAEMTATNANRELSSFLYEFTQTADRLETMYGTLNKMSSDLVTQISYLKSIMQIH